MEDIKIEENKIYNLNCLDVMREMLRGGSKQIGLSPTHPMASVLALCPILMALQELVKHSLKEKIIATQVIGLVNV